MKNLLFLIFAFLFTSANLTAEVYPLRLRSGADLSSCICVGQFRQGSNWKWVFITNRHAVTYRNGGIRGDIYVGNKRGWQSLRNVKVSRSADVASFTVPYRSRDDYTAIAFIQGVPDGKIVSACGYSDRERFCFKGKLNGNHIDASGQHVIPGDSGGPVIVRVCDGHKALGLVRAYRRDTLQSHFVPSEDCLEHLCQYYGRYPSNCQWGGYVQRPRCQNGRCQIHVIPHNHRSIQQRQYIRDENGSFLGKAQIEIIENGDPPKPEKPTPKDPEENPVEPDDEELAKLIKAAVEEWMKKYGSALAGVDGEDGKDGSSPSVEEVSLYLINNHSDELIVSSPSFNDFITRLEALENIDRPDLSGFNRRLAELEKGHSHPSNESVHAFVLVDDPKFHPDKPTIDVNGQTKAIVDEEQFGDGDAFILDISNLRK